MKKWINTLHLLLAGVGFTTLAYAQPANDACGSAIPLTVGVGSCNSILYTNDLATSVGDPATPACWNPASLSHSVWFSFVATTGDVEISTNFGGTLANTQLAVYSGACGALTQIGCQENINTSGGLFHTDVILHGLTVGNRYYLLVDGNGTATGTFGICVQQSLPVGPPLPTQDCTGSQSLCGLNAISVPNGPGGTGSSIEAPSCFGAPGERSSNWYSFTAATSGVLAFTIRPNTPIDYDFAVYNTTNSCPGTEVRCNWIEESGAGITGLGCGSTQCEPVINVVAGQTYTILVDRFTANSASGFSLNFAGTTATFASPNPTFTATTACIGSPTQFTNTTNGNFTYNWNFGDGFTSNLENPTHTYTTAGPKSVTLLLTAVPGGCQNAVTQTVTVSPLPTVDAGIGGNFCTGGCITLNGSTNATGSVGPVSFTNTNDYGIPDGSTTGVRSPITVSGAYPAVITAASIASVCLNITHTFDGDLDIYLQAPDGTRIELSTDNGGAGDNYTNTCFSPTAATAITAGAAPFTGSYLPEQSFNGLNGHNANGTWQLVVMDDSSTGIGIIRDWTITFNNNLPAYTWSPTTGMTNATTLAPTVCPTATTTYTLTANNAAGCTSTDTVTVNLVAPTRPVISCGTPTTTSVQFNWAAVTGATSYTVSYQVGANPIVSAGNIGNVLTYSVVGLSSGTTVTITVTPVGGSGTCFTFSTQACISNVCVPPIAPTIATTPPTCTVNGFSTITNYDATATYTFSPSGPTVGTAGAISGAAVATSYTVTATKNSCTSAPSTSFTNLIMLVTPAVPVIATTPPTCTANGFSTITNYDATATYTFSPSGPTVGTAGTISGAAVATPYTVTATKNGCTSAASASFTNLIMLVTPVVPTVTTTAPTCTVNGFSTITNYDATATYTFSPSGPTVGTAGTISGAAVATSYTVTATKNGCTSAASASFTNLPMLVTPVVPTVTTTAPTCTANGFTTIANYDAAATYTFSPIGPSVGTAGTVSGAVLGTSYIVTATKNGCTSAASASFTNLPMLVTPVVPTVTTTAPTCTANGFTTITNYDAAATYTFSPSGPSVGTAGTISGAVLGTSYTVTATKNGCTSAASASFTNLSMLVTPVVPTVTTTAPTCAADGFTTIANYDAAATYTFSPSGPSVGTAGAVSGAALGTSYTVTATKNGCTSAASASFTNLPMLVTPTAPILATTAPTCTVDGYTTMSNYNPSNTYIFTPAGPIAAAGGSITGAVIGTSYTVTANQNGCSSAVASFTNALHTFNIATLNPPPLQICDPNNDGIATFNLNQVIPGLTGGNPYLVSFHETATDAAIGGTTIPFPGSYDNIINFSQTIYIRVQQSSTSPCYVVIPLQLIVNRTPEATEPNDYHVCDDNNDGYAFFNLSTVASEVFGLINPSTHNISYYISLSDAQSENNPITSILSYQNLTINTQTIWIRVEDNATGCYDIVTLELIVDPKPNATQPNYPSYSLCDTTLPLAHEQFDLGSRITSILLGQMGMNVTFHFSQTDADTDSNPLPLLYTNIVPHVQTIWIRIENRNTNCYVLSTMDIRVEPLPSPIPPNTAYTVCDNNQDGYGSFNLTSLTNDILQGANYTISYHETINDAQLGNNPLLSPYQNINPFVQFIYVLAVDNLNGCRNVIPIELQVEPQPIMTTIAIPNLVQCDDDNNPQDQQMLFDLTQNDNVILAGQSLPSSNYTVTYHVTQSDANAGNPYIVQSTSYVGTNNQIIWVRIENNVSHCYAVGSFILIVNAPLQLTTPAPLNICDADANPNNQFTAFDLTVKNSEINQGTGYTVTYYPGYPVTASSVAIPDPTSYTNISAAVQTLGVMVTTNLGCKSYTTLDIRVLPIPTPNIAGIRPLPAQCDVNNTGDMLEYFDLTVNAAVIINGDPNLTLQYYPSQNDALSGTNEIMTPTNALVGQNVWIRVENTRVDYLGNNCFVLVEQPLTVNPLPLTITPVTVQNCDDDNDGQAVFNLTQTTAAFYGTANFTYSFYTTANGAQLGISPIPGPTAYTNVTNPQVIYVRVVDNLTGCVNYNGQFTLAVDPKPTATAPANFNTCDDDATNDGFYTLDLSTYTSGVIGTQVGVAATFYNTQNDAINQTSPITDLVNYQAYTHTVWIRVQNTATGCYELAKLDIIVEKLAEPNITSPYNTICVEYGTNNLLSGLTLNSGITSPNYTFEWFLGGNPIPGAAASTYTITADAAGDYTVVATSTSALGCISNVSNAFNVIQSGPAQFSTPAYTISNAFDQNQVVTINVVGLGQYEFSLDDGPFQSSNIFENVSLGGHTITVKDVKGNYSCGEIVINDVQTIDYPHYFTPNGDGYNDTWNVAGLGNQPGAQLYIFDRFGKLLKQISTGGNGWDGTYNGQLLPSTDYWFKIEYLEQSQLKEFRAHFTLKR